MADVANRLDFGPGNTIKIRTTAENSILKLVNLKIWWRNTSNIVLKKLANFVYICIARSESYHFRGNFSSKIQN